MRRAVVFLGDDLSSTHLLEGVLAGCAPEDVLAVGVVSGFSRVWSTSPQTLAASLSVAFTDVSGPLSEEGGAVVREWGADCWFSGGLLPTAERATAAAASGVSLSVVSRDGTRSLLSAVERGDQTVQLITTDHRSHPWASSTRHRRSLVIHPDDTGYEALVKMGYLVRATVAEIIRGTSDPSERELIFDEGSSVAPLESGPETTAVDWSSSAEQVRNLVRRLRHPLPGARVRVDGRQVVLERVSHVAPAPGLGPRPTGSLEVQLGRPPVVWAADGPLRIDSWRDGGSLRPGSELSELLRTGSRLT